MNFKIKFVVSTYLGDAKKDMKYCNIYCRYINILDVIL